MSLIPLALSGFRSKPLNWNCYQSILGAYNALSKRKEVPTMFSEGKNLDMMEEIGKTYGHGGHPSGRCGAIQAVLDLLPKEEHDNVLKEFTDVSTYANCEDIRGEDTIPCNRCVETAGLILKRRLDKVK
eukprot:gnl/Chilomastix_caulleri/1360.p1 GENE.gnl/Chilomastix_caulleri/1360~~gnl/Chilomastix_caulleri/1360.p1  ORF type:complete len:129 (+),score=12.33 gnl/Chilomastix_caulleri/1360:154-540(+)